VEVFPGRGRDRDVGDAVRFLPTAQVRPLLEPSADTQPSLPGNWCSAPVTVLRRKIAMPPISVLAGSYCEATYTKRPSAEMTSDVASPESRSRAFVHVPWPAALDPLREKQPALPASWRRTPVLGSRWSTDRTGGIEACPYPIR
jgi:hypothetical protein